MKNLALHWKIIIVVIILITCLSYYTESTIYKCIICEMSFEEKLSGEKDSIGFWVSGHPLD